MCGVYCVIRCCVSGRVLNALDKVLRVACYCIVVAWKKATT